jgi:hypothetical protein
METIKKYKEELQKQMAERFDKEFSDMTIILSQIYSEALLEGRRIAKQEMIDMLQGDNK